MSSHPRLDVLREVLLRKGVPRRRVVALLRELRDHVDDLAHARRRPADLGSVSHIARAVLAAHPVSRCHLHPWLVFWIGPLAAIVAFATAALLGGGALARALPSADVRALFGAAAPLLLPAAALVASAGFVACAVRCRVGFSWAVASAGTAALLAEVLRLTLSPVPRPVTLLHVAQPGPAVGVHVLALLLLALVQVRWRRGRRASVRGPTVRAWHAPWGRNRR